MHTYDLVIVGAGAAGLAAARYAHDHDLDYRIVYETFGGKAGVFVHDTEISPERLDYEKLTPLPSDHWLAELMHSMQQEPTTLIEDHVDRIEVVGQMLALTTLAHGRIAARSVILATGVAWHPVGVAGVERFIRHGLGYSIRPYAHLVDGKTVAVEGTSARTLRGIAELVRHASRLYWLVPDERVLATPIGQALSNQPNLVVLPSTSVTEVIGFSHIEEIVVHQANTPRRLSVEYLFVDRGLIPHSGAVCDMTDLDANGFVVVDQNFATTVPGLFAAGDVSNRSSEHAVVAIGDGTRAAMAAYDYILATRLMQGVTTMQS